jgi:hypothetical protein
MNWSSFCDLFAVKAMRAIFGPRPLMATLGSLSAEGLPFGRVTQCNPLVDLDRVDLLKLAVECAILSNRARGGYCD